METSNDCQYRGLINQGATCYLNSVIQTLFMTPEFRYAIYMWRYNPNRDGHAEKCVLLQLQYLFYELETSSSSVSTLHLTEAFGWNNDQAVLQQDILEFIHLLFEHLELTLKGTDQENLIQDVFTGQWLNYIECLSVKFRSSFQESFIDISLPIIQAKPYSSLRYCIDNFLLPEILQNENQYFVESMDRKVDAIKGYLVDSLPKVLMIQLKRFFIECDSNGSIYQKKNNCIVKFPLLLDMNRYISEKGQCEFDAFLMNRIREIQHGNKVDDLIFDDYDDLPDLVDENGILSPEQDHETESFDVKYLFKYPTIDELNDLRKSVGEWFYELYAVFVHSGEFGCGHYKVYIKDIVTQKWFLFNDSMVERASFDDISKAWGSYDSHNCWSSSNAYMLMYRKIFDGSNDDYSVFYPRVLDCVPSDYLGVLEILRDHHREQSMKSKMNLDGGNKVVPSTLMNQVEYHDQSVSSDHTVPMYAEIPSPLVGIVYLDRILFVDVSVEKKTFYDTVSDIWHRYFAHQPEFQHISPNNIPYNAFRFHCCVRGEFMHNFDEADDYMSSWQVFWDTSIQMGELHLEVSSQGNFSQVFVCRFKKMEIFCFDSGTDSFKYLDTVATPQEWTILRWRSHLRSILDSNDCSNNALACLSVNICNCRVLFGDRSNASVILQIVPEYLPFQDFPSDKFSLFFIEENELCLQKHKYYDSSFSDAISQLVELGSLFRCQLSVDSFYFRVEFSNMHIDLRAELTWSGSFLLQYIVTSCMSAGLQVNSSSDIEVYLPDRRRLDYFLNDSLLDLFGNFPCNCVLQCRIMNGYYRDVVWKLCREGQWDVCFNVWNENSVGGCCLSTYQYPHDVVKSNNACQADCSININHNSNSSGCNSSHVPSNLTSKETNIPIYHSDGYVNNVDYALDYSNWLDPIELGEQIFPRHEVDLAPLRHRILKGLIYQNKISSTTHVDQIRLLLLSRQGWVRRVLTNTILELEPRFVLDEGCTIAIQILPEIPLIDDDRLLRYACRGRMVVVTARWMFHRLNSIFVFPGQISIVDACSAMAARWNCHPKVGDMLVAVVRNTLDHDHGEFHWIDPMTIADPILTITNREGNVFLYVKLFDSLKG